MKNLKKVLALVMAFATAFTVMAGAAFTDAADIEAGTAVDMLSALGVIKGYEDGSFKPDGTVTRAEMAKMIFTIRSGGNDNADSYASTSTTFTDINGHWAAGYIKYCQSMGIIAGKSATTFDPDGLVTGVEAAKMMLVTMGYNADKAGLVGTTWSSKTLGYANENGLLDDVNAPLEQGLPRQYAAQLLYNGLDADTVTYDADSASFKKVETTGLEKKYTKDDESEYTWVSVTKNQTVGMKYLKLDTIENEYITKVEKEDGRETFSINNGAYTKVKVDYSNLMGQKVKVMIKDNDTSKVYGVYVDDDSKVVATGSVGTLDTVSSDTKKVKLNDVEYKLDTAIGSIQYVYTNNASNVAALSTLVSAKDTTPSYTIKMIDNDNNGKIDRIVVTPLDVKKVTYVSSSSITAGKTYKFDDADIYEGVAKNDYAVIVSGDYTVTGDPVITKADIVTGEVQGTKSGTPLQVRVNDTWYKLISGVSQPSVGDKVDLAIVGNYAYSADITAGSAKDVMFISASDVSGNDLSNDYTVEARAYFTDGSNKKIKISKINGMDIAATATPNKVTIASSGAGNDLADRMFTYTTNKDGNYEIKDMANDSYTNGVSTVNGSTYTINKNTVGYDSFVTDGAAAVNKDNKQIAGKSIADDAVVFVKGASEVKVLTGKTIKDWTTTGTTSVVTNGALVDEDNGIDYVKIAALTGVGAIPSSDGDRLYAYLTEDAYTTKKNGDTVTAFEVWTGSKTDTLYEDGTTNSTLVAGSAISYVLDGDEIEVKNSFVGDAAVAATASSVGAYAIVGIEAKSEGTVKLFNKNTTTSASTQFNRELDKDAVFIRVNDDKTAGVEGNTVEAVTLAKLENNRYSLNAYVFINSSNKIVAIIYDEDGALDLTTKVVDPAATLYTVTFNSNGGTAVTAQSVVAGEQATQPTAPTKVGYTFAGWYSDAGLTTAVNFNTAIDGAKTYYAKWTQIDVTGITGVPTTATQSVDLLLTGTVAPATALNQTIVWTVKSAGATGATIVGNTLSTTAAGTVVVTATIVNGTAAGDYTKDFTITVS